MSLQRESSSTAAAGMIGELQHPHLVPCELQRTSIFERVTSDTSGSIFKQQTSATFLCRVVHVATKGFLYHDSVAVGASLASVVIAAGLLFLVSRCLTSRFASRPQVPLSTATMSAFIQFLFDGGESTRLVPLKMLYLIHYMAFSTQTFLPMYFDTKEGYTKFQIGVLLAIPCVCSIIGPVVWGAASDIFQNQKLVHIICLVSAALLMFVLKYVESFEVMCIMFFIANFQTQPTWSLLDQVAMEMLDRIGGDYGKQRLYGAVGYGIGGYMAGVIAAAVGIAWCFNMVVALSCISLYLLMYHIPSFQRTKPKMEFFQSLSHILQQRDVLLLFVLVLVIGIIAQLIDSFLFLYLFNLSGNNSTLVGVVIAVETTSELPLFFHANRIIDRLGTPRCIFMGVAAYAIRLLAYILVENPWTILPVEAMHGITFGLVWAAFTNYVYQSAPEGTEGTMIGLLAAVQKGVGGGIGTLIGGWIYQNHGGRVMWAIALFGVLPVALLIAIAFSFLAKSHRLAKSVDFEDQPIKRRTPSYGAIHHLGSSQHLDTLG